MDSVIDTAAGQGLDEVVIGMPHRGRLNVLFNIVGKPLAQLFAEFDGNFKGGQAGGSGDVKYHLGAEGEHLQMFGDGEIKVTLTANPSHLEAVDPVLVGMARAKQDILDKGEEGYSVVPLMLHGDASFAGLGIIQETINISQLRGYTAGGTVHVVVNNQIGFTTTQIPRAPPTTPLTWLRASIVLSSTSMVMTQRQLFGLASSQPSTVVASARTSSLTSFATACAVTTRLMILP